MFAVLLLFTLGGMLVAEENQELFDRWKPEGVEIYVNSATHDATKDKPNNEITVEEVYNANKAVYLDSYSIMTINAEEWLCNYADKYLDANAQKKIKDNWVDQYIKITGEIHKIRYDFIDGCTVIIKQQRNENFGDGWCKINLRFYDEAEIEKVLDYRKGDKITVLGYSRWSSGPSLIDCYLR